MVTTMSDDAGVMKWTDKAIANIKYKKTISFTQTTTKLRPLKKRVDPCAPEE